MRTVIAGVASLKISVDEFMQYFVWNSLNAKFQDHLVIITNNSKPSLTEINDNIFKATERYLKDKDNAKNLVKSVPKPQEVSNSLESTMCAIDVKKLRNTVLFVQKMV